MKICVHVCTKWTCGLYPRDIKTNKNAKVGPLESITSKHIGGNWGREGKEGWVEEEG